MEVVVTEPPRPIERSQIKTPDEAHPTSDRSVLRVQMLMSPGVLRLFQQPLGMWTGARLFCLV